uniref:Uncharacterized protein n=1 Tax=Lutzomyia longipalpis TaxID=7200 RepID=A0A7G3B0T6_LUTLO
MLCGGKAREVNSFESLFGHFQHHPVVWYVDLNSINGSLLCKHRMDHLLTRTLTDSLILQHVIVLQHWPVGISFNFLICEIFMARRHGLQKALLIDKGNENNSLPLLTLPIQIRLKFRWVVINNVTLWVCHESLICLRKMGFACGRKNSKQLLKWQKGATHLKVKCQFAEILQITHKGSIVVRIVPSPGNNATIVVKKSPLECFNVALCLLPENVFSHIWIFELGYVVIPLVEGEALLKYRLLVVFIGITRTTTHFLSSPGQFLQLQTSTF